MFFFWHKKCERMTKIEKTYEEKIKQNSTFRAQIESIVYPSITTTTFRQHISFSHLLAIVNNFSRTKCGNICIFFVVVGVVHYEQLLSLTAISHSLLCSVDRFFAGSICFSFVGLFCDSFHCFATTSVRVEQKSNACVLFYLPFFWKKNESNRRHSKQMLVYSNRLLLQQFSLINIIFIGK